MKSLDNLFQLDTTYENGSMEVKRQVIGSMYPEKLSFDGDQLRTTRINEAVRIIYALSEGLAEKEKGQSENISALSFQVEVAGQNSNLFWMDINKLIYLEA